MQFGAKISHKQQIGRAKYKTSLRFGSFTPSRWSKLSNQIGKKVPDVVAHQVRALAHVSALGLIRSTPASPVPFDRRRFS